MTEYISINNLTLSYQNHPAIHHLDAVIPTGESMAIIGPNGAGKSTLLKIFMGFIKPDAGSIEHIYSRSETSYLPQQTEIKKDLPITVGELVASGFLLNIGLGRRLTKQQSACVTDALKKVGLEKFEKRSIKTLSGGQLQRVLFARIIVQNTGLILLDEPFNAVDEKTVQDLCELIVQWKNEGKTVIAVLHDFQKVRQYFTYVLLLAREKVACGKTCDVFTVDNIEKAYSIPMSWDKEAEWCEA